MAAEVDDDRPVARREPLGDLAPVEGAGAGAAVEEDDRHAAATLADGDPPTGDGDGQHAAAATVRVDCRSTNHLVDSCTIAPGAGTRRWPAWPLPSRAGGFAVPDDEPATDSKLRTLEEAAETIADGSTIAIGGLSMNSVPMAFIRTLARRKVRDLTVVAIVHGMPIEWLVAAGCVR